MDLGSVESSFTTWMKDVSGLTVHWRRQPPKALRYPYIDAEVLAIRGKGHDERVFEHDHVTDIQTLYLTGVRALTLSMHFLASNQSLGQSARQHAELFRTKMFSPSSLDYLLENRLALGNMLGLQDSDFTDRSGRQVSQVTVDLLFELRSSIEDELYHNGYVRKVDLADGTYVTSDPSRPVLDEDGNIVPDEPGDSFTVTEDGRVA